MLHLVGNYNVLEEFKEEKRGGIIRVSLHRRSKDFLGVYRGRGMGKEETGRAWGGGDRNRPVPLKTSLHSTTQSSSEMILQQNN